MAPDGRAVSLTEAEKRAHAGEIESQDTQEIIERYHRLHGVGERSSSPAQPLEVDPTRIHRLYDQQTRPAKANQTWAGRTATGAHISAKADACVPSRSTQRSSEPVPNSKTSSLDPNSIQIPEKQFAANPTPRGKLATDRSDPAIAATLQGTSKGLGLEAASDDSLSLPQRQARTIDASVSANRVSPRNSSRQPTPSLDTDPTGIGHARSNLPNATVDGPLLHPGFSSFLDPANEGARLKFGRVDRHDVNGGYRELPPSRHRPNLIPRTYSKRGRQRMNMDSSQSPTQSNDGRSYEQYLPRGDDLPSPKPFVNPHSSQPSEHPSASNQEDTTLNDDDTGAVTFDHLSALRDTQTSAPNSLATDGSRMASSPYKLLGLPETPVPPKNPFGGSRAALMPSSQMFKHTQSAYKPTFSPTSSRPSPEDLRPSNAISPNPSPLKRVSDPSPLQGGASRMSAFSVGLETSPRQDDDKDELGLDQDEEVDQEQQHIQKKHGNYLIDRRPRSFPFPTRRAPIEDYEPIHKSQQERLAHSDPEGDTDEDMSDDEYRRQQRVALKKAKVAQGLKRISLERERATDDAIIPSTKQDNESLTLEARQYVDQCSGHSTRDSQHSVEDTQNTVHDSQDRVVEPSTDQLNDDERDGDVPTHNVPVPSANISSNEAMVPNTDPEPEARAFRNSDQVPQADGSAPIDEIPETSPPNLRPIGAMMPNSSDELSKPASFSTILRSPAARSATGSGHHPGRLDGHGKPSQSRMSSVRPPMEENSAPVPDLGLAGDSRSEADARSPSIPVGSSPPAPALSTRARLRRAPGSALATAPPTSPAPGPVAESASSISPLSRLTTTPALSESDKTTPLTEESPRPEMTPSSVDNGRSSPAVAKAKRQKNAKAATSLRAPRTRSSFASNVSVSTDELARSPTTPTFGQSTRFSRSVRASIRDPPASRDTSRGTRGMFSGMVFAISFQSRQQGEKERHYNARVSLSEQVSTKIKQAGGKVLTDGFDKLFDICPAKNADRNISSTPDPDEEIELNATSRGAGFTALIADGHSRKVKYMQALALGLPCIHERWITTCMEKQRLVDWSDYLLCAGNSSFLGEAVRSRNLPTYDAATAKLSDVIQYRPRLLDRSRILLIMPRADESKKAAYVFLARVLGASLSRVYTVEEARKQLKAREDAGHPFDWVYVDDKLAGVIELFADPKLPSATKKRKRKSEVSIVGPAPKKIRTLSDELVIQSLILGRLMEEGEMTAV